MATVSVPIGLWLKHTELIIKKKITPELWADYLRIQFALGIELAKQDSLALYVAKNSQTKPDTNGLAEKHSVTKPSKPILSNVNPSIAKDKDLLKKVNEPNPKKSGVDTPQILSTSIKQSIEKEIDYPSGPYVGPE